MVKQRMHIRRYRSGRVRLVNKGIRRRRMPTIQQYKYTSGIIKNARKENVVLANTIERLRDKLNDTHIEHERDKLENKIDELKYVIRENNNKIIDLNTKYFPKNKR